MINKVEFESWLKDFENKKEDGIGLGKAFIEKFLVQIDNQLYKQQCNDDALRLIRQFYIDDMQCALGYYER